MQIFNQMFRFVFLFSWGGLFLNGVYRKEKKRKNCEQRRKHTPLHTTKHVTEFQIYVIKRTHTQVYKSTLELKKDSLEMLKNFS